MCVCVSEPAALAVAAPDGAHFIAADVERGGRAASFLASWPKGLFMRARSAECSCTSASRQLRAGWRTSR